MADLSNFWFLHLAALNFCFGADPHPTHFCPIWCRLQIPAGFGFGVGDAFPSSESVARSVVAALAARSAG